MGALNKVWVIILCHSCESTLLFFARLIASDIDSIAETIKKFVQSFATLAASTFSPNSQIPAPPASCKKGLIVAIADGSPETRKFNFFARAASGRPITGQAI